jgi:hypothetical protein
MPQRFSHIHKTHWGFLGDMGNFGQNNNRDNLWSMDSSFVLQDSFFEIPISWESKSFAYSPFSDYGEKTYYTRLLDNNVYSVEKDRVTIPYKIDFGVNNWPDPHATFDEATRIIQENPGRYISEFDRIQETDGHIIIQFLHEGQNRLGIYDKESAESAICSMGAYTGKYFIPFGDIVNIDSEAIYAVVHAYQIKRMWNGKDEYNDYEANFPDQIRRLREDFPIVDENGNPFLVMYRFKK